MSEISSDTNTSSFVSSGEMKSSPFSSLITKMNEGNYEMWAMQVKRTLIAHDKEHLILEPEPVQKVGKYVNWFKDNSLVMVWIVGTLSQDIANEVLHKESAKDMWDSLAATYSQARNETRIMQLHHDIHQMCQDGRPFHTYYSSLKSMFERLNSYFPACKCEQQKAYRDMLMVGVFLSGLDSVYESAKNQMLTSPSIPPIDEAYSRLSRIPIPTATVPDTTFAMFATRGREVEFQNLHVASCETENTDRINIRVKSSQKEFEQILHESSCSKPVRLLIGLRPEACQLLEGRASFGRASGLAQTQVQLVS
ncbi:hypothetical protein EJ110_NYTH57915 [Nymphaea thermarum]|nr:hypothetical protein EJ110_NYTH57915 [Nymphaea thermarum]